MINWLLAGERWGAFAVFVALFVLFTFFALSIASADWLAVGALLSAFVGLVIISRGVYFVALVWLLGSPTIFDFPNRVLSFIPGMSAERLLFAVIVAMIFLGRAFKRTPPVPVHRAEFWASLFLLLAFASLLGNLPDTLTEIKVNAAMYIQGYLLPLGALFIARRVEWTRERIDQLILSLTIVGIFLAITAVLQQYFGVTFFVPQSPGSGQFINQDRASATFGNPHELGAVVTALIVLALLQGLRDTKTPGIVVFYFFAAAFMSVALILTKTRAPWLAALAAFAFLFIQDRRVRPLFLCAAIAAAVIAAILAPVVFDPDLWRHRIADVGPIYNRLTAYATALNAIVHNPFLGMGFTRTAFDQAKDLHLTGIGPLSAYWAILVGVPHNEFLHIALLTGVPGLVIYLMVVARIAQALARIRRIASDPLARAFALYVSAILISYIINAMFIDFIFSSYFTMLLYFLAGTAIRYGEDREAARPA